MKRFISIAIVALALAAGLAYTVITSSQANAQTSASLSIVPKKNYTIEPGKSIKDTLVIRNIDATQPLNLTLRVIDFTYTDDGGSPKLMLAEDAPQTAWSLKPYLTVPKNVTIEPRGSATIDMGIDIAKNQGGGSLYSAIVYSTGDPTAGGNVGLNASGVTLVFANIPGPVDENLTLTNFGAYHGDRREYASYFTMKKPEMMAYTLQNDGNVTAAPSGSITLRHMFGGTTVITDVNPTKSLALIGQERTLTACVKQIDENITVGGTRSTTRVCEEPMLWPGFYSAKLELFYGQNGNETKDITGSSSFWYLPAWFLIVMLAVIALIGYFTWKITRKFKQDASKRIKLSSKRRR